jgi:predicted metal-binding membrane protein
VVVREEERDPVRLDARLQRGLTAAIAGAWALAIVAEATGKATLLHHDGLIEGSTRIWIALPVFLLAWQVMLAAMMLPSSLPLVRLFARASARQPRPRAAMAGFLGGYALVWGTFGALAFVFDIGVHATVDSSPWLRDHDWILGAGVLAVAGAFQFSSLKYACLDKCRHPAQFLMRFYERGAAGGLRLGLRHGAFCLGCCWALMLVMFSVGVASLVAMAVLTGLMVYEKTQPRGREAVPVVGVAMVATALVVGVLGA